MAGEQDESMQIQAYEAIRTGIVYAKYAPAQISGSDARRYVNRS